MNINVSLSKYILSSKYKSESEKNRVIDKFKKILKRLIFQLFSKIVLKKKSFVFDVYSILIHFNLTQQLILKFSYNELTKNLIQ